MGARPARDALGDEGEGEGARVGQHVASVGEEREAVGEDAAGDGGAHRQQGEDQGRPNPPFGSLAQPVVVGYGRSGFRFPLHPPRLVIMTEIRP